MTEKIKVYMGQLEAAKAEQSDEAIAELYIQALEYMVEHEAWEEALPFANEILAYANSVENTEPGLIGKMNLLAGQVFGFSSQFVQAVWCLRTALEIMRQEEDTPEKDLALGCNLLGAVYLCIGRRKDGFSLCEESLGHYRAILPEYSLSMEHSCTVAAETYAIFGYHRQALSHYAEALKINKVLNRKSRNLKDRREIQKRRKQLHRCMSKSHRQMHHHLKAFTHGLLSRTVIESEDINEE